MHMSRVMEQGLTDAIFHNPTTNDAKKWIAAGFGLDDSTQAA